VPNPHDIEVCSSRGGDEEKISVLSGNQTLVVLATGSKFIE